MSKTQIISNQKVTTVKLVSDIDYSFLKKNIIACVCNPTPDYTQIGILCSSEYVCDLDGPPQIRWSFRCLNSFTVGNNWGDYKTPQEAINRWLKNGEKNCETSAVYAFDDIKEFSEWISSFSNLYRNKR